MKYEILPSKITDPSWDLAPPQIGRNNEGNNKRAPKMHLCDSCKEYKSTRFYFQSYIMGEMIVCKECHRRLDNSISFASGAARGSSKAI